MKQVIKSVIGYVRISSDSQKDNTSIAEQNKEYRHIVPVRIGI
ncbi:hypothetical protein RB620_21530 [Paenibacillus sp. LHD-117]|nr:hypothetical protein [Paenibacillus sp. LHD-117]MDQ6422015.1 hypothetical protein [Paenibacillus sp. LHD-117]